MGALTSTGKGDPSGIEFLALEGGGGKGFAFVGAIEVLEEEGVLPLQRTTDEGEPIPNQIRGISGASAGAITALLLALGLDSKDIRAEMENERTIRGFMDDAAPGVLRRVSDDYGRRSDAGIVTAHDRLFPLPRRRSSWLRTIDGLYKPNLSIAESLFRNLLLLGRLPPNLRALCEQLLTSHREYLHSLVHDWGFFPGLKVRHYFRKIVSDYLPMAMRARGLSERQIEAVTALYSPIPLWAINFHDFMELTGVDLVTIATNLDTQRALEFSAKTTPRFPVVEAVAMSMNLPLVYKPIYVDRTVMSNEVYQGFFLDGGLLNNLPLHAFDDYSVPPASDDSTGDTSPGLHPAVLGLRLTPGDPPEEAERLYPTMTGGPRNDEYFLTGLQQLIRYVSRVGNLVYGYGSEEAQIRDSVERRQVVELFAGELNTVNFLPSKEDRDTAIERAREATRSFFR